MKEVFLNGPMMDKKLSHVCQFDLFLVKNIVLSKTGPMSGKWFDSWNDFSKNDGDMMFMR